MKNLYFSIIDENNNEIKCKILHTFRKNKNNYIIFTDETLNEEGQLNILTNKYIFKDNKIELLKLDDDEINIVNEEWSKINNG